MMSVSQQNEMVGAQSILQQTFNDSGITIANHATGGTSSSLQNELRGLDGNGAPYADRIKLSKASIVIESHTLNDALGGETIDDYRQYLVQWVVDVRAAGKVPVLEESGPVCDGDHPQLAAYVQAMDDAATQYNVALIAQYQYLLTVPNYCSHLNAGFYPDDAIYAIKAQREAAALTPIIKTLVGE
ncbi:hypothetical protein R52603_00563 [Paraburkholderia saeva]|nr:hypothetical protein R52603_00563 [Paraburkholderia saeva]